MSPLLAAGVVAALALTLYALDRFAGRFVRPALQPVERTVSDLGLPFEEIGITSGEHTLQGWLLGVEEPSGEGALILLAHGWGANHGVVLRLGAPLAQRGHAVLLFDVRGHGRNRPLPEVTVRDFRDDIMAAARYAHRRFPDRALVVVGHSMGGAGAVLAAADGAAVDGLILIASPSDTLRVTAEYLTDHGWPGTFLVYALRPFFWRRVGGSFLQFTPSRRISEIEDPLLLIQPELDARVVRPHAERLSAAAGRPYHLIEGYEHTDVLEAPETVKLVEDFVEKVEAGSEE
ncbi:MAG: alpha/beta fold hydrolase [Gemmatimonadetes bacterium]|nr:alpha/beta fold hydrolase [Gemmatimonadota bacterium]NNF12295.1 alpha/beta fold hydrolase [Gemmatimonadota bacterium]NNL31459.1 alpha/beta fold hydrolase [Gemmatimonadota bacterium]